VYDALNLADDYNSDDDADGDAIYEIGTAETRLIKLVKHMNI
jgi:hypothetical protein